jgi:hypothetical protein
MSRASIARTFSRAVSTLVVGVAAGTCNAQGVEPEGSGIRWSGFGTAGVLHADAPAGWGFRAETSQPANNGGTRFDVDSLLGLQLNYQATQQFELVGQVVAARRSRYASAGDAIEWAFVAWRPNPDVTLRVGRVSVDQLLFSAYRDVGFAYPYVRLPVELYGSVPRSLDGVDLNRSWNVEGTKWQARAYLGRAKSGDLGADARVTVQPIYGVVLSRDADGLLLRLSLSRAYLDNSPNALQPLLDGLSGLAAVPVASVASEATALRSRLDASGSGLSFFSVGMNYEWESWQLTSELTRSVGHPSATASSGYVSVGRRIGPVTVFGIASRIRTPGVPVETPAWEAALTPVLGSAAAQQAQFLGAAAANAANHGGANQQTVSLGMRWDVGPQLGLKVQWDHVRIDANGSRLWSNGTLQQAHAEVVSAALVFVF